MKFAQTLALAAALAAPLAHAEFFDGNELLRRLQSATPTEHLVAIGYIAGVHDTTRGGSHCSPDAVTSGQLRDMVRAHLERNPQVRHLTADAHVVFVLREAWPCQAQPKRPATPSKAV